MPAPTPSFPTSVWTGVTAERASVDDNLVKSPGPGDWDRMREEIQAIQTFLAQLKQANIDGDFKIYVGDGVNSSGGADVDATFTGAVVGERVLAVIGQTKAADGNAQAALNSFFKLTPVTEFAVLVGTTNKIAFKSGLADQSAKTFFAICAPARVAIA